MSGNANAALIFCQCIIAISVMPFNGIFYAFSQFCHFKPSTAQKHHFIRSLIKPVFTYNFELWCNSATEQQINRMTGQFNKRNFDLDMDFYLLTMIKKTATKFISDPSHILQGCYKTKHFYYQMPKAAPLDF